MLFFCYNTNMYKNYGVLYNSFMQVLTNRQKQRLVTMNMLCTYLFYCIYPLLLIYVLLFQRNVLLKTICIPLVSFVIFSKFRALFHRKRPYETYPITPLIPKESTGNSFPSRHIFSAVLIATTYLYFCAPLGILLYIIAFVAAIVRVLCGVHYFSDVCVGYIVGILCGLCMFL